MSPSLSIVIPSYRRADLLALCLESVADHAPRHTQVIVVDDGSAQGLISRTARQFAGVEVIRLEKSSGFCIAANRGIAAATGSIVELLNDDTQVEPGWSEQAMKWFEDESIASVAPLVLLALESETYPIIDSAGDEYNLGGYASKRGHRQPYGGEFACPREVFGASASSAFYRREVLQRVGGFPEQFGAYFEDVDLSWRIRRAGFRTMYEPSSIVWHYCGSSYRVKRSLLERQSLNEERVYWRNVPQPWRCLPKHLAVLGGKSIRRCREGTLVPFWMGRLRAVSELVRGRMHSPQEGLA
jgi:GT2 family glycosyltransferase